MPVVPSPIPLLEPHEPAPFRRIAGTSSTACLIVCDHASNRIPAALDNLGVDEDVLAGHLAADLGAAALTESLAGTLGLPAVLCNYSRLVVDCNRSLDDPSAFLGFGDGTRIPGNCELGQRERKRRADAIYWPYHEALAAALGELESGARRAVLFSVHSFTPVLDGLHRPWDAGLLWDKDARLAQALLDGLSAEAGLRVGDNVPYSGRSSADFTVDYHGESAGRAHVALEVRQDHLATPAGVAAWAARLAPILAGALADPALFQREARPRERLAELTVSAPAA